MDDEAPEASPGKSPPRSASRKKLARRGLTMVKRNQDVESDIEESFDDLVNEEEEKEKREQQKISTLQRKLSWERKGKDIKDFNDSEV